MYVRRSEALGRLIPVDTGRKLNVHKTLRRLLGRLLSFLCTFNLRPVSTGMFIPCTSCLQGENVDLKQYCTKN